jgi:dephospho-CoA kinase
MKVKTGTKQNNMKKARTTKVIGITGGIGAGKSLVLDYIKANYRSRVLLTDEIGEEVVAPGGMCYTRLKQMLPREAFDKNGYMNREAVSKLMYDDPSLRQKMNDLIHPAVGIYLVTEIDKEKKHGLLDFVIIESALYDGSGFATLCNEVWSVNADLDIRKKRLMESRGYSEEKVDSIFASQANYDKMRKSLPVQIDNNGDSEKTYAQIDAEMNRIKPGSKREI